MALVNTGLVVRYYIDEASSGTSPTAVVDSSGNSYNLDTINYGSGNLAYTEVSGNRGLESTSTTGTQRASHAIDNSSDAVRDAVAGGNKFTIEVVMDMDSPSSNGGRIFGINGRSGQNGELMLKATGSGTYYVAFDDTDYGSFDPGSTARMVLHIVIDTTQSTQNDRIRYSLNGGSLTQISNSIALNATLALANNQDLIMFNRQSGGSFDRSWDGILFYAALYTHAFSASDISTNYTDLTSDDDTPAGGGGDSGTYYTALLGAGTL